MSKGHGKFNNQRPIYRVNSEANIARSLRHGSNVEAIWRRFSPDTLGKICAMPETAFAAEFGMETAYVKQAAPANFYHYKDNGSNVLAVAHLDTVIAADRRGASFVETEAGWVVFSGALDDRLGAYVILDLLPKLGITFDVLLTVGEECGQSTAQFFAPPKQYDWIIEFDRGDTDVVMYQYEDDDSADLVEASGARMGFGSFSDIAYLEHLGVKAFNWGVAYQDYHGPRGHAFLDDTVKMVAHFMEFHSVNKDVHMPHVPKPDDLWGSLVDDDHKHDAYPDDDDLVTAFGEDPAFHVWWDSLTDDERGLLRDNVDR